MLKIRIIPILTFNGFGLVKTKAFSRPRMVGNPVQAAKVYNSRGVDELIFLDIYATKQKRKINLKLVKDVIHQCFMPVGIGGGINCIDDIKDLLKIGADKVVINSEALNNPDFITDSAKFFGSQCICVSVDIAKVDDKYVVYQNGATSIAAEDYIKQVEACGAGELIVNSVDHDGLMKGFNIELYNIIDSKVSIPIVFVGGAGNTDHFIDLFQKTNCEAVGSSSIFHFTQFTPNDIKSELKKIGKPVRLND